MDRPPNKKQWARIKEVTMKVTAEPTPYWVYVRDYGYARWRDSFYSATQCDTGASGTYGTLSGSCSRDEMVKSGVATRASAMNLSAMTTQLVDVPFDAETAFNFAGRAEFEATRRRPHELRRRAVTDQDGRAAAPPGLARGEYVFLVRGSTFPVNRAPLLGIYEPGTMVTYGDHIDKRQSDGDIAPWSPSHGDLMAEDWVRATTPKPALVPTA